jgi:hypothetical protein
MPQKLPDTIRETVIEKWLLGDSRDGIAVECNISAGAVSNIVYEWRNSIGLHLAPVIRDLAVTLRRLGMSPAQCASGLRTLNVANKMGLDMNSTESFLSEVYTRLQELDVNPSYIARYLEGLVSLVDDQNLDSGAGARLLSLHKIDALFEKKRQYSAQLDQDIKVRKSRLDTIDEQVNQNEKKLSELLERNRKLEQETSWKSHLRDELQKQGLDVSNISKLVEGARFFNDIGDGDNNNVNEMFAAFSSYKEMLRANLVLNAQLESLKNGARRIQLDNAREQELLQQRSLKNAVLDSLKSMGFGLDEFKTLHNIILEMATENCLPTKNGEAAKSFISDIGYHHYDYVRLRREVERLKLESSLITTLNIGASKLGDAVRTFLNKKDITQDDVKNIIRLLESYTPGCISNTNFESKFERKGIKKDVMVVDQTPLHSQQLQQTVQASEKGGVTQQEEIGNEVPAAISHASVTDHIRPVSMEIDSKHVSIREESSLSSRTEADQDDSSNTSPSFQHSLMRLFKQQQELANPTIDENGVIHYSRSSQSRNQSSMI